MWQWILTKLIAIIILQYINISNHYVLHLKLIQCQLYLNLKMKTITFTIVSKTIKSVGIYLTKEVNEVYTENYKTLIKNKN